MPAKLIFFCEGLLLGKYVIFLRFEDCGEIFYSEDCLLDEDETYKFIGLDQKYMHKKLLEYATLPDDYLIYIPENGFEELPQVTFFFCTRDWTPIARRFCLLENSKPKKKDTKIKNYR